MSSSPRSLENSRCASPGFSWRDELELRPAGKWPSICLAGVWLWLVTQYTSSTALLGLLSSSASRWRCNQRSQSAPRHLVRLREAFVAHHVPNKNLQRPHHRPDNRHLWAAVGPDLAVPSVGDLEELKGRLATEKDTPLYSPEWSFMDFYKIWPSGFLVHGKPAPHPELERLQLQAGLQVLVDGRLGCRVLPLSQFCRQPSCWVMSFEGTLWDRDLRHSAQGWLLPRPVEFSSASSDRSRANQRLIVDTLMPSSLATGVWVIPPLTIPTALQRIVGLCSSTISDCGLPALPVWKRITSRAR